MQAPVEIKVKPNPVPHGGTITIKGKPDSKVFVAPNENGQTVAVKLDANGTATYTVPFGPGDKFIVTDYGNPASNIMMSVIST